MATPEFKKKLHSLLASFENKASNNFKPELTGYVPPAGKSGVTIATGFDLGQHNKAQIKDLNLPKTLEDKLLPYAKSKDAVKAKNLKVTDAEAAVIDDAVMNKKYEEFSSAYQTKFGKSPDQGLDENTRVALMSAFFNMGGKIFNEKENPSMVEALKSGSVKAIHKQIADFHQGSSGQPLSRRLAEAAIATGFIDVNDTDSISKFKDLMASNGRAREAYRKNWDKIDVVPEPKTSDQAIPFPVTPPEPKTSDQAIPYPVTPSEPQFNSMEELLGNKVSSEEPEFATMEELLGKEVFKNGML